MLHEHSPTYDLACNDFFEKYIDLIHVHQAKFEMFEASIIAAKEEGIFLAALEGRDRRREYRTVKATVSLLDKAASRGNTQRIVISVVNALDDFASAFNEACTDFWAAKNNKPDAPFRRRAMGWMTAYQTLYERLLRSVYAPVVTAYRVSNPSKQTDSFKLDIEGRARLKAIKEIEANSAYKMDLYRLGLNHSIRNAIAHRHFEIYTAEEYVEYWDSTSPRQRVSEDEIRQLCSDALVNASFIVDAIVLWLVNHRSVAEKRVFCRRCLEYCSTLRVAIKRGSIFSWKYLMTMASLSVR